jgi:hypothetical protein
MKEEKYTYLHEEKYGCENGRFPVSPNCVAILNPVSHSSSITGVIPGIRS